MATDDLELLREFAESGSERVFQRIVARHADLVYSAALRRVGRHHLAEEVTQAVFIVLARKAGSIRKGTILIGWLYRTTRYAANDIMKSEMRRRQREQKWAASEAALAAEAPDERWQALTPVLDVAMDQLREKDRASLLLRFFENRKLKEVAKALNTTEAAAQRRVARATGKLRKILSARGVGLPAATLTGFLSANAVVMGCPVQPATVTAAAVGSTAAVSSTTMLAAKGALQMLLWEKVKVAALACLMMVAVGGGLSLVPNAPLSGPGQTPRQAMQAALNALASGDPQRLAAHVQSADPNDGQFVDAYASMQRAVGDFMNALVARFGQAQADAAVHQMSNPWPIGYYDLERAIVTVDGDQAGVQFEQAAQAYPLVKRSGEWKLDLRQALANHDATREEAIGVIQTFIRSLEEATERISSGEYRTAEEACSEYQATVPPPLREYKLPLYF